MKSSTLGSCLICADEVFIFQAGQHHARRALRGDVLDQLQPVAIARQHGSSAMSSTANW